MKHLQNLYCFCWFKGKYLRASKTDNRSIFGIKILSLGRTRLRCLTSQRGNPLLPKNVPWEIQIGLPRLKICNLWNKIQLWPKIANLSSSIRNNNVGIKLSAHNLHQVRSKSKDWKVKTNQKYLGVRKRN